MKRTATPAAIIAVVLNLGGVEAGAAAAPGIVELTRAAESGDLQAGILLGMRYRDGDGVARDYGEALKWYRRCADRGDGEGMDNTGFMYLRGLGVPVDFNIAAAFFKAGAAEGHGQACFNLGNCYFSGQGVEQDYGRAMAAWERAAGEGHPQATWRLATLYAAGEGVGQDLEKARVLCESIVGRAGGNPLLLLGELCAQQGDVGGARRWWERAAEAGSRQARALLEVGLWRHRDPVAGSLAFVEVEHLYQGWNNCGATSVAMFARHAGSATSPYAVKRLCPAGAIGSGTDWADLVAAGGELGQRWEMLTFANDERGFERGVEVVRGQLDAGRPVVIDFTVVRESGGKTERFGHTLLVVGYNVESDRFVLKNPNQPPPGIELMSGEELKSNWYSRGYSRLGKGRVARPLIVVGEG